MFLVDNSITKFQIETISRFANLLKKNVEFLCISRILFVFQLLLLFAY
jgi:hypothetical protein